VLPEEFRVYAILVDWSTHHWTIDAYVLDEDNEVLFTFEGNSAASEVSSLLHTLLFTALHFTLVTQDNQWPTKRYMTYWQPRALPSTNLQGAVVLEESSNEFETTVILHLLDQIALKYTAETLKQVFSPSHIVV
jgi:fatty acid synthase